MSPCRSATVWVLVDSFLMIASFARRKRSNADALVVSRKAKAICFGRITQGGSGQVPAESSDSLTKSATTFSTRAEISSFVSDLEDGFGGVVDHFLRVEQVSCQY